MSTFVKQTNRLKQTKEKKKVKSRSNAYTSYIHADPKSEH